ncbi:MAG TPA: AAA family ATPase [Ktedonobacterales bacterium]
MPTQFMQFTHADKTRFEPHLLAPSTDVIHAELSPKEFERFLAYVFFCAGFAVEYVASDHVPYGPGVDLNLYANTSEETPFARIEARRYAPEGSGIGVNDVFKFAGVLKYAGDVPGYLITTAHFAANAQYVIQRPGMKDVRLIDGGDLLRYMRYLHGSRVTDGHGFHRTLNPILPDWLFSGFAQEPRTSARILVVANNKGGVGKTTSALNVGFALAALGKRILLVDMDGQANLTSTLPPPLLKGVHLSKDAPQPLHERFITEHFAQNPAPLQELIQPTRFEPISLLAANDELNRIDPGGSARPDAELAFARSLRHPALHGPTTAGVNSTSSSFDWIVVDTPPAQSHFARIAIAAADYVLIPLKADSFSVAGIDNALRTTDTMRALTGAPQARGLLRAQWRSTTSMKAADAKLQIQAPVKGYPLLDAVIPYDDHIEQAHIALINGGLKNVFGWRSSNAATEYRNATNEILQKMGVSKP